MGKKKLEWMQWNHLTFIHLSTYSVTHSRLKMPQIFKDIEKRIRKKERTFITKDIIYLIHCLAYGHTHLQIFAKKN